MKSLIDGTDDSPAALYVAFAGPSRVGAGELAEVARAARRALDLDPEPAVLVFDGGTAGVVALDLRGTPDEVAARIAPPAGGAARRGRPKLGVVAREVT